jgi:general secretion pathway protein F
MTEAAFRYSAIGADGVKVAGEIAASDRDAAILALRRQGQLPIRVVRRAALEFSLGTSGGPAVRQAAEFFAALAMLLGNGVALDQALGLMAGPHEDARISRVAARLRARVQAGGSLADAMAEAGERFDRVALAMIRAGEEGGQLARAAATAAAQLEAARRAQERTRAALTYPAVVLAAAGATLLLIATVVAPAFLPLFADRGAAPPLALALLAGLGTVLGGWWPLLLGLAGALWFAARTLMARPGVRLLWHAQLLALPRLGRVVAAAEIARFAQALGGMLEAGVRLPQALALAQGALRNQALAMEIALATTAIRGGDRLATALGTVPRMPPVARHLLAVGEQSGQVAQALLRIATLCGQQVQRDSERALALLGPALVVALGGLVALVIATLLGAVLDANQLVL